MTLINRNRIWENVFFEKSESKFLTSSTDIRSIVKCIKRKMYKFEILNLQGYSTVFDILDQGSEKNSTSFENSEKTDMQIFPSALD
jgi:hypothetical protein